MLLPLMRVDFFDQMTSAITVNTSVCDNSLLRIAVSPLRCRCQPFSLIFRLSVSPGLYWLDAIKHIPRFAIFRVVLVSPGSFDRGYSIFLTSTCTPLGILEHSLSLSVAFMFCRDKMTTPVKFSVIFWRKFLFYLTGKSIGHKCPQIRDSCPSLLLLIRVAYY